MFDEGENDRLETSLLSCVANAPDPNAEGWYLCTISSVPNLMVGVLGGCGVCPGEANIETLSEPASVKLNDGTGASYN